MDVLGWIARANKARAAGHQALSLHESAASRIVLLENLSKSLSGAPVDVQDYFREAICCLENEIFRPAIIMSWSGYFHMLSEYLFSGYEAEIRSLRPKWVFKDLGDLKESVSESHILIVAKDVKFISKAQLRMLDGQISERNQCAHPTLYRPSMNSSIGYVDVMIRQAVDFLAV